MTISIFNSRRVAKHARAFVSSVSCASIVFSSVTASFAQTIIIDPSAPGTSFLQTQNGTPQINIATPESGVSLNKLTQFSVGQEGVVLNNSTSNGVSIIGQNVTANPNLMVSGPASVIVGEVTGSSPTTMEGTTEVFGQTAAVIIANPNGLTCNGCDFINSQGTVLTTGVPTVSGADVSLLVTEGTLTIGPDGFDPGSDGALLGRHVVVDGPIDNYALGSGTSVLVSGGAQHVSDLDYERLDRTTTVAAPSVQAKTSPFSVDISENGKISSRRVAITGRESGQGVNIYSDVTGASVKFENSGDLFYSNVDAKYWVRATGQDVRQYGDIDVEYAGTNENLGYLVVGANSFTLYDGRKISTSKDVTINASEFVVIAGEVSARDISIDVSNGALTNTGFLMASGDLVVSTEAGISQQRKIAREYDTSIDPALQQYLDAYYAQLLAGGPEADIAAEMIARASQHEVVAEHIDRGASSTGTNVSMTSAVGDVANDGGAIAATNDVRLEAGNDIVNTFLALQSKLGAEEGCAAEDCGYRTDFHAGEILAGNDLSLVAGRDVRNEGSDIAAANNVSLSAGRDVVNSLLSSDYTASEDKTVHLSGPALVWQSIDGGKDGRYVVGTADYTATDTFVDEENILSPGRIASLYGDVSVEAERDFVSIGSQISAGSDLSVRAGENAIFSSFVDVEEDFVIERRKVAGTSCTGDKDSVCSTSVFWRNSTSELVELVTATTEFVARSISVEAGENITLLGARLLASEDLDLSSTNGSILIDSTDLPDEIAPTAIGATPFVELNAELIDQIFGKSDETAHLVNLEGAFVSLVTDAATADAVASSTIEAAASAVLRKAVLDWRNAFDDANPQDISEFVADLQNNEAVRKQLAEELLYAAARSLGEEAEDQPDALAGDLSEMDILYRALQEDGEDAPLYASALAIVDELVADLLANTLSIESTALTQPAITQHGHSSMTGTVVNYVYNRLKLALPSEDTEGAIAEFEALSVDEEFVAELTMAFFNRITERMNRSPLFAELDDVGDALLVLEADTALQRAVFEASLYLSPRNDDPVLGQGDFRDAILNGGEENTHLKRIAEELAEFVPMLEAKLLELIGADDQQKKADFVLEQDIAALIADTTSMKALVSGVATRIGTVAREDRIAETATNSDNFVANLRANDLLTAVAALNEINETAANPALAGAEIKDAVRFVGVQSFVSLVDGTDLANLKQQASQAVSDVHTAMIGTIRAHNTQVANYHSDIRTELSELNDRYNLSDTERTAAINDDLAGVTAQYQADVTDAEAQYAQALADNEAQYGHLLTKQELRSRWVQHEKGGYTEYYYVTVPDLYYIALKDEADALVATERAGALNEAATQRQLSEITVVAGYSDDGIATEIANLQAAFDVSIQAFAAVKTDLIDDLNSQVFEAIRQAELVLQQELLLEAERVGMIAEGTIENGESSLASSLTASAFPHISEGEQLDLVNNGGLIEIANAGYAPLLSDDKERQDKFINATAWRFATYETLANLSGTPRTVISAESDLNVVAHEDIYVLGETSLVAGDTLAVDAGRRIGLLGAINTNFALDMGVVQQEVGHYEDQIVYVKETRSGGCDIDGKNCTTIVVDVPVERSVWVVDGTQDYDLTHDGFVDIGETLQLGTLASAHDLGLSSDEALDHAGLLGVASQTRNYNLVSAAITSGGDLTLSAGESVLNYGGGLVAGDNLIIAAEEDIRNEALRENFTLTAAQGCVALACGREGHEYRAAEMLAGSGMILTAGQDIVNEGAVISAAGSLLASAENDIVNSALTSQYLYHYENSSTFFGLIRKKKLLYRAAISEGSIATEFGDLELNAGNDIEIDGSMVSAGGTVNLDAGNDVQMMAQSEELHNYFKKRGFTGLSFGQDKVLWNEFGTAFTQVEGENIYITAGRDATGMGALLFAEQDIYIFAGEDITFDAHQNLRYERRSGWSIGISFGGSGIIEALLSDGDVLEAYVNTNPSLAAVHRLATGDTSTGALMNLAYHLPAFGSAVNQGAQGAQSSIRGSLVEQLNPFSWVETNALFDPDGFDNALTGDQKSLAGGFLSGITFRLGAYKSKREWTESHVSQMVAGNDLWLDAGKDIALVGGTVASANRDALLIAGENVVLAALADSSFSESSSWGVSVGFTSGGFTIGGDYNKSRGSARMYTNAALTAGKFLDIMAGEDLSLMGANIKGHDVYLDVGNDLFVQSRQNTSESDSFGFNFSVSFVGTMPTGFSLGVNGSNASRRYTDTPATIVAQNQLSVYTEGTTYLLGSGMWSEVGHFKLDTGDLLFDNFEDHDRTESFGVNISVNLTNLADSDASGSFSYSDVEALTFATLGTGDLTVRDYAGYDFSLLNRSPDDMQRVISEREFSIEIPGINLKRWVQQVEDSINLLEAVTTRVPEDVAKRGEVATDLFRDAILQGLTRQEALTYTNSQTFRDHLQMRENYLKAIELEDSEAKIQALYNAIVFGETMYFDPESGKAKLKVGCATTGPCDVLLEEFASDISEINSQALIDLVNAEIERLDGLPHGALLELAYACAIELAKLGYGNGPMTTEDEAALAEFLTNDIYAASFHQVLATYSDDDPVIDGTVTKVRIEFLSRQISNEERNKLNSISTYGTDAILELATSSPEMAELVLVLGSLKNRMGSAAAIPTQYAAGLFGGYSSFSALLLTDVEVPVESTFGVDTTGWSFEDYVYLVAAEHAVSEAAGLAAGAGLGYSLGKLYNLVSPRVAPYIQRFATNRGFETSDLSVPQIRRNQIAGDRASDQIALQHPNSQREVTLGTSDGPRRIDVLTENAGAIESKVGRTSADSSTLRQVNKDRELLENGDVASVAWEFRRSEQTGRIGPTPRLQAELEAAGIEIRIVD